MNIGTGVATKISKLVEMVAARFPELMIQPGQSREAEYSRADTTRLREYWDGSFIRIEDYILENFVDELSVLRASRAHL
jgi:hypothetical protein